MKSKTIGYSESHECYDPSTGLKSWRKVWYEAECGQTNEYISVGEGLQAVTIKEDSPDEVFQQVKQKVQEWLVSSQKENLGSPYGTINSYAPQQPIPEIQLDPKEQVIQSTIDAIKTSTSLKAVEIFRKLVERENNESLTTAFHQKLKSFQQ